MRALHIPSAGDQPVLGELPVPEVTEGTVLVRVHAAALNAIDTAIAAGAMAEMVPHIYPVTLGRDAAGTVEAVGSGVSHVAVGDEVIAHVLLSPPIQAGTLADFVLAPAASVTHKPAGLSFADAAALPLSGAAAVAVVEAIAPKAGQTVLVNGASGGVGSYAVQLLALDGVTVLGTGTAADSERLTALGVSVVIDFTAGSVVDQVRALYPEGVDALVNVVGFSPDDVPVGAVRQGGIVSSTTVLPDEAVLTAAGLTGSGVLAGPVREVVAPLAEQAASGALQVDIHTVLPLDRATEGLSVLASGQARGKIVVTLD